MTVTIGRRELLAALGGAVAAWPLAARAQQRAMSVIGLLSSRSPAVDIPLIGVIRQALNETGLFEGQNVTVDYRWAEGQYDRLAGLAADLVRQQVAVIITIGGESSALAAKAATATIPIVFAGATSCASGASLKARNLTIVPGRFQVRNEQIADLAPPLVRPHSTRS
jgi:putative tryptophan/tyrosine transport system substrate-binding protein